MTHHAPTVRPSYRRALRWIVENDDTEWLEPDDRRPIVPSVAAVLVADLFGHSDEKVIRDLQREMNKRRSK